MAKRKRCHYADTDTWIDDMTGATFERRKDWTPSEEPDVNYPHKRLWRKLI